MNPKKRSVTRAWTALTAGVALATTVSAHGSSNDALLDALVGKGHLTEEEAAQIRLASPAQATPKSKNVQELRLRGRIQGQFAYSDGRNADEYSTFELRRARLGVEGRLFEDYTFNVELNTLPTGVSLRSAFVSWVKLDEANITFGYDKPRFGFEENTSSASILTVERSLISNRIIPGERTGLRLHGATGPVNYYAGVYNHTSDGASNPSGLDDYIYNLSGELKLDHFLEELSRLRLRADWLGTDGGEEGYPFDNALSFSLHTGFGPVDLRGEYLWAEDFTGHVTRGWYVMPSIFVVPEKLELVGRYEKSRSDTSEILRHNRYAVKVPRLVSPTAGDGYEAFYIGANYYIRGNDLKLMLGAELAELENSAAGQESKTLTGYTAVRMQF